jgi:hypothetical protein
MNYQALGIFQFSIQKMKLKIIFFMGNRYSHMFSLMEEMDYG